MKIAINHREDSYSTNWIEYCKRNNIDFVLVNSYDSDIIDQIKGCDIFMWNWAQWHSRDVLFARQLMYSIEQMGILTYPNLHTCLLFDDKLGQKYYLESLNIEVAKSKVFFYKQDALNWIKKTKFPVVFKLRGGSSGVNVKLVNNKSVARKLIRKSFSSGFRPSDRLTDFKDRITQFKKEKDFKSFAHMIIGIGRIFLPRKHERMMNREKGYIYFQEYIPNNDCDIRVFVSGEKACAVKRFIRKNDFRASGSGVVDGEPEAIDVRFINLAFKINEVLKMQTVAFDFVLDNDEVKLLEISYATGGADWIGYYTRDAVFVKDEDFLVEDMIIENIVNEYLRKTKQEELNHEYVNVKEN